MATAHGRISAGICGFVTEVTATSEDQQHVHLEVRSTCESITGLAGKLPELDAYAELGAGFEGEFHQAVRASLRGCCSGCVVPAGLYKAMQVAAGVALPQAALVELEKVSA